VTLVVSLAEETRPQCIQNPKRHFCWSYERIVVGVAWAICDTIPRFVMFLNQSVKSPFINHHSALKKVTTFDSVPPQQL
jgi:hypothetical protein